MFQSQGGDRIDSVTTSSHAVQYASAVSSRVSQNTIAMPSTKTLRAVGRPALRNGAPRATADRNIDGGHEPYADWLIEVAASPVLSKEDAFSTPNTRRRRFSSSRRNS